MTTFQTLLKMRTTRIKNGKSPLPLEILRAFQADRKALNDRAFQAVQEGLIKVIKNNGDKV